MVLTLNDRIADRVRRADYRDWRNKVTATGGCAQPIRLFGSWQLHHHDTNQLLAQLGGDVMVPCGNRRASVCQACSDRYSADAYHLMRAGLTGGSKGVPVTVAEKPRVFATLTAPSFGPVHNRPTTKTGKARPCTGCQGFHHPDDPRLGGPVDPGGYDYVGAVLWQAHAGKLWHRFTIALRRHLARAAGLTVREFRHHARISYAKVAEYQRRGLVHFHAVIRVDGPAGSTDPAPAWATVDLVDHAVRQAARSVLVVTHRPDGVVLDLAWGDQVDVRPIRASTAAELEDQAGAVSDARLAGYVAKYATKGTGARDTPDRPIRSQLDIDHLRVSTHHRRMIQTAWDLGGLGFYAELNLRKWAHMLGFRGHFLTKSKHYSATFKRIREDRRAFRAAEVLERLGLQVESVVVVNDWAFSGSGYANDAERELATALGERLRNQRQRTYAREGEPDGPVAAT
ncbi:replication initiator [Actinosynnema sp. NPDC047251]|uniref:Replication initiator protein n=1 Tax=Saccharothrix espanaensis (strain ATCC 51144 / DSM 44229 / JCM 9112 / NBRC 15066 / NRRL 15764) TaxID=1179773 RepID=K0KFD5_SACES|nr:replication initiator [Saccharothrix espanaensis]CCH35228.1 Replication initiator protein [Saccharothrix espanaensis DSM 44229]